MKANFISNKLIVLVIISLILLGGTSIVPGFATINQSPNIVVNSASLQLVDLTNDSNANGFDYTYNISSTDTTNFTLQLEIYRYDGLYTYLVDNLTKTVPVDNNTVSDNVSYNCSLSGTYSVKSYWFSSQNYLLYFKEYSNLNISGLNQTYIDNPLHTYYEYWWHWQLGDLNTNYYQRTFTFSIDFYFYNQYNVTLNYNLALYHTNPNYTEEEVANVSNAIQWSGTGGTFQHLSVPLLIDQPGSYKAIFIWKDILIYPLGDVNRSIEVNFGADAHPNNSGPNFDNSQYLGNAQTHYYSMNQPLSGLFSVFMISSVFILVVYVVHRKTSNQSNSRYYRPRQYQNGRYNNSPSNQPRLASFCSNCGSKILANGQYCPDCGTKMD